jgi:predicted extracellular nuclease
MLVTFPQPLVISEYFNYERFGEIVLAQPLPGEDRPYTGTAIDEPATRRTSGPRRTPSAGSRSTTTSRRRTRQSSATRTASRSRSRTVPRR